MVALSLNLTYEQFVKVTAKTSGQKTITKRSGIKIC